MKRFTLVLCLCIANFSLTSFGIISNPNTTLMQTKACKSLVVNSKSSIKVQQCLAKPSVDLANVEMKNVNQKSFFKSFFGFVYNLITKVVSAFAAK
jgi:hypothetical protein